MSDEIKTPISDRLGNVRPIEQGFVSWGTDVFRSHEKLERELIQANGLLRSAYAIAMRAGGQTNWQAFRDRVHEALVRQSRLLYGTEHPDAATCTPKPFRAVSEE